jgi:hypothetical protein
MRVLTAFLYLFCIPPRMQGKLSAVPSFPPRVLEDLALHFLWGIFILP